MTMESKRLVRSRSNVMLGGVCAGFGDYLGIDPTLVRLFFVLLAFADGIGFFIYMILWLVLPREGAEVGATFEDNVRSGAEEMAERARGMGEDFRKGRQSPSPQTGLIVGAALIILGSVFLLRNLDIPWLSWMRFDVMWPLLLIAAGGLLLIRRVGGE
jgi:phage shock protein PspC (stress-responsive transcriptional regulator)